MPGDYEAKAVGVRTRTTDIEAWTRTTDIEASGGTLRHSWDTQVVIWLP